MTFIIDHLIAILVGATLLGALLFIQHRGQQSAVETAIRHRAETQTSAFLGTITRDLENARTSEQITTGLGTWSKDAVSNSPKRAFGVHGTATHTDIVELVTLVDPAAGAASPLQAVVYESVELPDSVEVAGVKRPLYRVDRHVYRAGAGGWVQRGGSAGNLTSFVVRTRSLDGGTLTNGRTSNAPATVAVELMAAEDGVGRKTAELAATTRTNATRQAITVRVVNASSTGGASDVAPGGKTSPIPRYNGFDPPPTPPSGGGGGGGGGGGSSSNGGGSGSSGSTAPPGPDLTGITL